LRIVHDPERAYFGARASKNRLRELNLRMNFG
jgi:hypothetical protein